jgi:uncharacterized protein (DUF2384 family)
MESKVSRPDEDKPANDAPTQAMIERAIALAIEVFQDDTKVVSWLKAPHPVFGVSPILKMRTREGLEAVEESLERLAHGIY